MRLHPCTMVLAFLAFPAAATAQGAVHVVDAAGGPGSDFTSISQAASAAANGDVLLVRAGDYGQEVGLNGKGLTVVAEAGATVELNAINVDNLPAARFALFQALEVRFNASPMDLVLNDGPIWFEACLLDPIFGQGTGGALVAASDTVVLSRSQVEGIPFAVFIEDPTGLRVTGSRLHVFDSEISAILPGTGLFGQDTFVELSGSTVRGGNGPNGSVFQCNGTDGGDGLVLSGTSVAKILDSALVAGTGGAPFGACTPGVGGEPLALFGDATATTIPGMARSYSAFSPVREDGFMEATFSGKPGDLVWIVFSTVPGAGVASVHHDLELLLGTPRSGFFVGTIPPAGTLVLTPPVPDLPAGWESTVIFSQALFRDIDTNRLVYSAPSAVVILDASF